MQYQVWQTDASTVRTLFRMYFIIVLFLLSIIGRQCAKCAAKAELLKGKPVSLHRMTGWLHANDIGIVMWKLHRLPGGWWLGTMMVITSILSVTSDLLVTRLINPTFQPGFCPFDQGLVIESDNVTWAIPPPNGYPKLIASNAQLPLSTACSAGIYKKVPQNGDWYFCGGDEDIIGWWDCTDLNEDYTWPANTALSTIGEWLVTNNYQYANGSVNRDTAGSGTTHEVFWSSSAPTDDSGQPFDCLISLNMNASYSDTKTFKTYHCTIQPSQSLYQDPINKILSKMLSMSTIGQWAAGLAGILYMGEGTAADLTFLEPNMEQYLNTMIMVEGGNNDVLRTTPPGDFPYYGCLTSQAQIHPIILFLIAFAGFIFLVTLIYYLMLLTRISTHFLATKFHPNSHTDAISNVKPVPDSTLSWILQAARENALEVEHARTEYREIKGKPVGEEVRSVSDVSVAIPSRERELRDWRFEVVDMAAGVARVVKRRGGKAVLSVMSSPQQPRQEEGFGLNQFSPMAYGQQQKRDSQLKYGENRLDPNIYGQQSLGSTSL